MSATPVQTPGTWALDSETMAAEILELVRCESPSVDRAAVARSAEAVDALGTRLFGEPAERIVLDGVTHLRWRFGGEPRVLILGHHDTVWPVGSLDSHPAVVSDGRLTGPGSFDMKTGVVIAIHAVASLKSRDGVTLLITGDEELGSPSSRKLIEAEARGCAAALVLEASGPGGALKTERKGASHYEVCIYGKAAHAGLEPQSGVNATLELAHQALAVTDIGRPDAGTTVTVTAASSGTTTNTVPAEGRFAVDVRAVTVAEQERVHREMNSLPARLPGASVEALGGISHPPFERDASQGLFERARRLAAELGLETLDQVAVGGASDGNFTAGLGIPTLDGLGAVGGGAHADGEHVLVNQIPGRTRLLSALLVELLTGQEGARP